ncbi:DNA glycosylase [Mycena sp. CBHHK59/15]|nr:DNA glycosylase [Mycena sp. CBHHK59/15]
MAFRVNSRALPRARKKIKIQQDFTDATPFPTLTRPTDAEAREWHTANILEDLISTILSQSTSGSNSSRAKAGLDTAFGRNNFSAIVDAPLERVVESIRCGGLATKKAATIQNLLSAAHERHGSYSLQFLVTETDAAVTQELLSYDGVGPKTASCVLSLCLHRESFAVDTHIWRLSKVLGWAHLEHRLPGDLKYGLHVLMMHHGRTCSGCKKGGAGMCVLKEYVKHRV